MQTEKAKSPALLHRQLKLKVEGKFLCHGSWETLMGTARRFGHKDWEIVEVFALGEKIVTKHKSLLSVDPSFLIKENNKGA